jgi:hypothetical protein
MESTTAYNTLALDACFFTGTFLVIVTTFPGAEAGVFWACAAETASLIRVRKTVLGPFAAFNTIFLIGRF